MRNVFLVCYDVADDKRLRKTYKRMLGFGDPLQYSVFRCELSATERQALKEILWDTLNWQHDRVMLIDLGPAGEATIAGRIVRVPVIISTAERPWPH